MLRVEEHGIGYAHLTLPADKYEVETGELDLAGRELERQNRCLEHHVYYLTGHSDVMLAIRVTDFRSAFHLDYTSEATGTNWLFGVPYLPSLYRAPSPDRLALTYIVHLRLVRDVLRQCGVAAEEHVVSEIQRLLRTGVRGEVLAGFGWSDLMLAGTFEDVTSFIETVKDIQRLEVAGRPAIRRVLTILGYDRTDPIVKPTDITVRPVILARAAPNRIHEVADRILREVDPEKKAKWTATSVDGKWDIVLNAVGGEPLPLDYFLRRHRLLAESNTFGGLGLERLETHLLTTDVWTTNEAGRPANAFTAHRCTCEAATSRTLQGLEQLITGVEPTHLQAAIRNVLGLFRAASKDPLNCCEVSAAFHRCQLGLKFLLTRRSQVVSEMNATQSIEAGFQWSAPRFWYEEFSQAQINVQDWCTYAEKVVSQRTVGRFEEFLSQNERVVSYRGGVQKLLYLADALLNGYAARYRSTSGETLPMVCLFDPVDIVHSHRDAGIVRMPARFLFILPVAINHLWHEVGGYAYFQKPRPIRERVITDRAHRVEQTRMTDYTSDVGDVYADAVTLLYGYRGRVGPFVLATAYALFERPNLRFAPAASRERFLGQLLLRLYLASECATRAAQRFMGDSDWRTWVPKPFYIKSTVHQVVRYLRDQLLDHPRFKWIDINENLVRATIKNIGNTVAHGFRPILINVIEEMTADPGDISVETREALESIVAGDVVDFVAKGADINDVFRLMQERMIDELRMTAIGTPHDRSFFREIAALMRSSILSFYKMEPVDTSDGPLEDMLAAG